MADMQLHRISVTCPEIRVRVDHELNVSSLSKVARMVEEFRPKAKLCSRHHTLRFCVDVRGSDLAFCGVRQWLDTEALLGRFIKVRGTAQRCAIVFEYVEFDMKLPSVAPFDLLIDVNHVNERRSS